MNFFQTSAGLYNIGPQVKKYIKEKLRIHSLLLHYWGIWKTTIICWRNAEKYIKKFAFSYKPIIKTKRGHLRDKYSHMFECDYTWGIDWWLHLLTTHTLTNRDYTLQITDPNKLMSSAYYSLHWPFPGNGFYHRNCTSLTELHTPNTTLKVFSSQQHSCNNS
jgi:hypothetical protein